MLLSQSFGRWIRYHYMPESINTRLDIVSSIAKFYLNLPGIKTGQAAHTYTQIIISSHWTGEKGTKRQQEEERFIAEGKYRQSCAQNQNVFT